MLKLIAKDLYSAPDLEDREVSICIYIYIGAVEIVCSDLGEGVSFVITTYWFIYLC